MSGRRWPAATWASCTRTPPAPPSTARACASWSGRRGACGAAGIATTLTPGRLATAFPFRSRARPRNCAKYKEGLKVMNGGLTLSGGEPFMQHRFAIKLLTAVKKMGIHTAIETNGYFAEHVSDAELANVDMVLLGIKSWGEARHKDLTGMDISPTLAFAERLATLRKPMWIRFVLVPGLTDDAGNRQRDCRIRRRAWQRQAGRGAALPPAGTIQVEGVGAELLAGKHVGALARVDSNHGGYLPGAGFDGVLAFAQLRLSSAPCRTRSAAKSSWASAQPWPAPPALRPRASRRLSARNPLRAPVPAWPPISSSSTRASSRAIRRCRARKRLPSRTAGSSPWDRTPTSATWPTRKRVRSTPPARPSRPASSIATATSAASASCSASTRKCRACASCRPT